MGWFGKKSVPFSFTDKVWKTEEQSWKGLGREALLSLKENRQPVIISFFSKDKNRMEDYLQEIHVPLELVEPGQTLSGNPGVVYSCLASDINSSVVQSFLEKCHQKSGLSVLLPAHYPLIPVENKLLEKLSQTTTEKVIPVFCIHLQSPLLNRFGSENIIALMDKLGMKDDECIENPLVTKSIIRVREKLAQEVLLERASTSEEEWFNKNMAAPQAS